MDFFYISCVTVGVLRPQEDKFMVTLRYQGQLFGPPVIFNNASNLDNYTLRLLLHSVCYVVLDFNQL